MKEPTAPISQEYPANRRAADQPQSGETFRRHRTNIIFDNLSKIANETSPQEALRQAAELASAQEFRAEEAEVEMIKAYDRADKDNLTGLLNRGGFERHAGRRLAFNKKRNRKSALVRIDIDNFKQFNEKNGHKGGDEALREVGNILEKAVRTDDPIARYGGDEYEILLDDINASNSTAVLKRIMGHLAMSQNRKYPDLSFSMGIALAEEEDTLDSLKEKADSAAIALKLAGKHGIGFWGIDDPEIQQTIREQFRGPVLKDANVAFTSTLISSDENDQLPEGKLR